MRLRYTLPAFADLTTLRPFWITSPTARPRGAKLVHARIRAVTDLLLQYPMAGAPTDNPTIRRVTTTPYPYVIFYEVTDDKVIIHVVRHGACDPYDNPGSTWGSMHEP
jgi:toxin ParE1/3/4